MQQAKLIKLGLKQITSLQQEAFTAHENCASLKRELRGDTEAAKLSVKCKRALRKQQEWVCAILEALDLEV